MNSLYTSSGALIPPDHLSEKAGNRDENEEHQSKQRKKRSGMRRVKSFDCVATDPNGDKLLSSVYENPAKKKTGSKENRKEGGRRRSKGKLELLHSAENTERRTTPARRLPRSQSMSFRSTVAEPRSGPNDASRKLLERRRNSKRSLVNTSTRSKLEEDGEECDTMEKEPASRKGGRSSMTTMEKETTASRKGQRRKSLSDIGVPEVSRSRSSKSLMPGEKTRSSTRSKVRRSSSKKLIDTTEDEKVAVVADNKTSTSTNKSITESPGLPKTEKDVLRNSTDETASDMLNSSSHALSVASGATGKESNKEESKARPTMKRNKSGLSLRRLSLPMRNWDSNDEVVSGKVLKPLKSVRKALGVRSEKKKQKETIEKAELSSMQRNLVSNLWSDDGPTVAKAFGEMRSLCMTDRQESLKALECAGSSSIVGALRKWWCDDDVTLQGFLFLGCLHEISDNFAEGAVRCGVFEIIMNAMENSPSDQLLQSYACGAIFALVNTESSYTSVRFISELKALAILLRPLLTFPSNSEIQKNVKDAFNSVKRFKELSDELALGEPILRQSTPSITGSQSRLRTQTDVLHPNNISNTNDEDGNDEQIVSADDTVVVQV